MRSLATIAFAAFMALFTSELSHAQSGSAAGPQRSLRSRLPFSGPTGASAAQMGVDYRMRQTGRATGFTNSYAGWAGQPYSGMGAIDSQSHYRGPDPMLPVQQRTAGWVAPYTFNPTNLSSSQGQYADQQAFDEDYAWMDFEPAPLAIQQTGTVYPAAGVRSNNTANATNVQGYTGAIVPGADQAPASGNAMEANTLPANPGRGLIERPLMERMPQTAPSSPPAASEPIPEQRQQPDGVSETATSGPIKY